MKVKSDLKDTVAPFFPKCTDQIYSYLQNMHKV